MNPGYRTALAIWLTILLLGLSMTVSNATEQPSVPVVPGVVYVIAVANVTDATAKTSTDNVAQGDYELIVSLTRVDDEAISESASIDAFDASGKQRQAAIPRQVQRTDLASAPLQILGFHTDDTPVLVGTTSLGPSLAIVKALVTDGRSDYSFRNFANQPTISGTLDSEINTTFMFPVLINGQRVELRALRATGQMSTGTATRPFELLIYDDSQQPLALRIAYGPRNGSFPFKPEFAREIVRIDTPTLPSASLAESLQRDCRVEIPGIYFDFDRATLKPQSRQALIDIATALRSQPGEPVRIEGHTDNIGSERYNDDLSSRRAAAVRVALVDNYGADADLISTAGLGARRPVDTNDTLAGRAHNRRVELVRVCADGAVQSTEKQTP